MRNFLLYCLCICIFPLFVMAEDVVGFWKTINNKTGKPDSILAIYEYAGKYFGRLVATYGPTGQIDETIDNPKDRAAGVKGHPFYNGLDILWDLKPQGNRYVDGKIMDPQKGKIYNAKMWLDKENLIVRGEILFFGQNQIWPRADDSDFPANFKKPDLSQFVPVIPEPETNRGRK